MDNRKHALIWRRKSPGGWKTTILFVGEWDAAVERWRIADDRLRRLGLDGHVEVRSVDDPKVAVVHRAPWFEGLDRADARLALLPGDQVRVHIYGNTYSGTVVSSAIKGCVVRFSARTRKGGWGGEPPERERRFPIWPKYKYDRGVKEVIR